MKVFVKMHVMYIIILIFCGLRIRKHFFGYLIQNFPNRKVHIEVDWTEHEPLLSFLFIDVSSYILERGMF